MFDSQAHNLRFFYLPIVDFRTIPIVIVLRKERKKTERGRLLVTFVFKNQDLVNNIASSSTGTYHIFNKHYIEYFVTIKKILGTNFHIVVFHSKFSKKLSAAKQKK